LPEKIFKCTEKESGIFGKVKRPLIQLEVKTCMSEWLALREVLADTGADISIFPREIGEQIVENITNGKMIEIKGIVPFARVIAFIHTLTIKINGKEFTAPVAIAESNDVPPILGRVDGLNLFNSLFAKGEELKLQWG
jgi:predicted aspartyl protease